MSLTFYLYILDFKAHSERGEGKKIFVSIYVILNFVCIINNVQLILFILYIYVEILVTDIYLFQNDLIVL